MEAATSRLRSFELSATTFRRLAGLAVFALWLIVSTGAVVRLTRSGLGCEHWPGCEPGRPFPEKDYHAYVEFGNRLVGGVTIFVTLALAVGGWFTRGLPRWARWLAVGVFAGTLAQAPLGAITVYANLHPALVIPHLLLSIAVLGAAIVVGVEAFALGRERGQPLAKEPRIAGVGIAAACFGLIATGSVASAAGPHSRPTTSPSCPRMPPVPLSPSPPPNPWRTNACGTRWRRPSRSGGGGRVSFTTRPFRSWAP